jgi:hypothetical protein
MFIARQHKLVLSPIGAERSGVALPRSEKEETRQL